MGNHRSIAKKNIPVLISPPDSNYYLSQTIIQNYYLSHSKLLFISFLTKRTCYFS